MLIPNTVVYLVRHPVVHLESRGICYGDSDVHLQDGWEATLEPLDSALSRLPDSMRPTQIWHSDLIRCTKPARWLADRLSIDTNPDRRLRERFFGTWQSVAWSAIPPHELEQAHSMLEHPSTFRPGGGETTDEVSQRALHWWREVVSVAVDTPRTIVAFAHSGSITSLCGNLLKLPPLEWTPYYPKPSQYLVINVHANKIEVEV